MTSGKQTGTPTIKRNRVLIKSKYRVRRHGEVFTPQWVIDKMMAIPGIKEKTQDIFATFLEPSAGEGAFLLAIEELKLRSVKKNYPQEAWDKYALWALASIYGIEFLEDNLATARRNMLKLFVNHYQTLNNNPLPTQSDLYKSAKTIIWANVVQGDTLTRKNLQGEEIAFSHWKRVPGTNDQVRREAFTYGSLFADKGKNQGIQLNLFDPSGQDKTKRETADGNLPSQSYVTVDIELVWRGEKSDA